MERSSALNVPEKKSKSSLPISIPIPQFDFEQDKWATSRTQNVEDIASHWKAAPFKVRVLTDKKFAGNSMVMLRKDSFEKLVNLLKDLQQGEAVVEANLEAVFNSIKLIETLAQESDANKPAFKLAVKNLTLISGALSSVIEFGAPVKKVAPSELTAEEIEDLKKNDEDLR